MKFWQEQCPDAHGNKFQINLTKLLDQGCKIELQKVNTRTGPSEEIVIFATAQLGGNFGGKGNTIEEAIEQTIIEGIRLNLFVV